MQLNKLFHQYRELVISIGILLISVFGILLGVVPLMQKTVALGKERSILLQEIEVLTKKVSILESIDEESVKKDLQTLLSAVPSDKSISGVLGTLDELTAQTGVFSSGFSLAKLGSLATASAERLTVDEKSVGSNIVPFTVSISGNFNQVREFLAYSIFIRRLFRVRTFDVSFMKTDTESTSSAGMVSARLSMDAFYSPLPTSIGSVGQPITTLNASDLDVIAKVAEMQLLVPQSSPLPPPALGPAKSDPFSL